MQLHFWTEPCRPSKSPVKRLHKRCIMHPTSNLLPCPFPFLTSFRDTCTALAKEVHLGQDPTQAMYCIIPCSMLYLINCKLLLSKVLALVNSTATAAVAAETEVDDMDEY